MLLIGMKISLTKKPTKPITTKPMAVRNATLVNSAAISNDQISTQNSQIWGETQEERGERRKYLYDRACGTASRGGRCPSRTPSSDRRHYRWHPLLSAGRNSSRSYLIKRLVRYPRKRGFWFPINLKNIYAKMENLNSESKTEDSRLLLP